MGVSTGPYLVDLFPLEKQTVKPNSYTMSVLYGFLNNRLNIIIFAIRGSDGVDDASLIT